MADTTTQTGPPVTITETRPDQDLGTTVIVTPNESTPVDIPTDTDGIISSSTGSIIPSAPLSSPPLTVSATSSLYSSSLSLMTALGPLSSSTVQNPNLLPPKVGSLNTSVFVGIVSGGLAILTITVLLVATIFFMRQTKWRARYFRQDQMDQTSHERGMHIHSMSISAHERYSTI